MMTVLRPVNNMVTACHSLATEEPRRHLQVCAVP